MTKCAADRSKYLFELGPNLNDLFFRESGRRIFAIVATTSIPVPGTPFPAGSRSLVRQPNGRKDSKLLGLPVTGISEAVADKGPPENARSSSQIFRLS